MHEVAARDRTKLARSEEARDRNIPEGSLHRTDVVIGLAKEALTAPVARKEQRPSHRRGALWLEHRAQVLARRLGIANLELNGLPHLGHIADRDRSGVAVDPDEVADDEVAATELGLELGRGLTDVQAAPHQELIALCRRRVALLDALERRLPTELEDDVALGSCDRECLPDRPATLRDNSGRPVGSFEDRADRTLGEDLVVRDET